MDLLGGLLGLVGEGEKEALTKETSLVLAGDCAGVGEGEMVMTGYLGGVIVMTGMWEGCGGRGGIWMEWSGYLFLLALGSFLAAMILAHLALVAAAPLAISSLDRRSRRSSARKRGGGIKEFLFTLNPSPGPPTSATDSESESEASSTTSKLQPKSVVLLLTLAGPLSVVVPTFLGATVKVMSSPLGSDPT